MCRKGPKEETAQFEAYSSRKNSNTEVTTSVETDSPLVNKDEKKRLKKEANRIELARIEKEVNEKRERQQAVDKLEKERKSE